MLAVATEENDLRTVVRVLVGLSLEADEWTEAFEQSLEAAAVARRGGCGGSEMTASANAVEFAVETGAWAAADELLAEVCGADRGCLSRLADFLRLDVALLAAYRGDQNLAGTTLDQVVGMHEAEGDRTLRAWYGRVRAVALLTAGDLPGAYDEAVAAVDLEPLGPNGGVAAWCAARAALWLRDAPRARAALERMPPDERGGRLRRGGRSRRASPRSRDRGAGGRRLRQPARRAAGGRRPVHPRADHPRRTGRAARRPAARRCRRRRAQTYLDRARCPGPADPLGAPLDVRA